MALLRTDSLDKRQGLAFLGKWEFVEYQLLLIVEHHQRVQRAKTNTPPTPAEVVQELRRLADLLEVFPAG